MKNIKRKILQIILTVFMVFSSCFLTGTVKAEDTTSNTGSSNYFTNNLVVESDRIIGESNFKGEKPTFEPSDSENGSDLSEGATEGQVWTNKIIEKAGQDGMYKITFQAIGFKYRYVDDENEKDNDIWKNPLKEGTSLSITEDIDSNFHVVNGEGYQMEITQFNGFADKEKITFKNNKSPNMVELSFDANNVTGFNESYNDEFNYSKTDGVAFDVEASFYVRVNEDVEARMYETKDSNSSFEPAADNFYYYKWGFERSDAYIYGISWNSGAEATGFPAINGIGSLYLPSISGNIVEVVTGDELSGGNGFFKVTNKNSKYGNFEDKDGETHKYQYASVVNDFNNQTVNNRLNKYGIRELIIYLYRNKATEDAFFIFEVIYTNDDIIKYYPQDNLGNEGGNTIGKRKFYLGTVTKREKPNIRLDKDPDGDGIINETFNNHGQIVLRKLTEYDLKAIKSATLKDWDKRTYKIDLYASHNIMPQDKVANIMLMLDVSGSMPWFVTAPTGKQTNLYSLNKDNNAKRNETLSKNNSQGTLKEWEYTYYVKRLGEGNSEEYKPIAYTDGEEEVPTGTNKTEKLDKGWYTIKSASNGNKVFQVNEYEDGEIVTQGSVLENETIYTRNPGVDKTKLEALYTALDYFIENIEDISPTSKIAYVQFAGVVKESEEFAKVSDITASKIINNCKLYGGTNQYAAIEKANEIISTAQSDATSGITKDNTYAILFTDGDLSKNNKKPNTDPAQYYSVADVTNIADTMKTNYVNLLFGAGIFAQLANGSDNDGVSSLKKWVSTDPVNNSSKLVYIGKNSDELINEFSEIFGKITFQISNADIIDYIDKRFIITDENGNQLKEDDTFAGGTIGYNDEKGEYYIIWEDVNLSYSQDGLTGWHQTIYVKAKDEYIGGNDITTNGAGSGIIVGDVDKEFNQPEVNVKVDFVVGNADDTIFLGETIPTDAKEKLFDVENIYNSKGTKVSMGPDGDTLTSTDFTSTWYKEVDGQKNRVDGDSIDISDVRPQNEVVYYLEVKLNGVDKGNNKNTFEGEGNDKVYYDNTVGDYLLATNDQDKIQPDNIKLDTHNISDYAKESSKYGVYIVDVVSGSIIINKKINEMTDNDSQGDPIFTFHITGTTVSGKKVNEYRSIRFEEQDDLNQLVATIAGLEKGQYTIAELDTVRYEFNSVTINNVTDQACSNSNDKITNCYIGYQSESNNQTDIDRKNVSVTYINNLINENDQTDTDIITNSFIVSENGIVISAEDYIEGNE